MDIVKIDQYLQKKNNNTKFYKEFGVNNGKLKYLFIFQRMKSTFSLKKFIADANYYIYLQKDY